MTEIRLLQALAGASQGGAELHFLRLCLALHRAGVEQRVVIRPHEKSLRILTAGGIVPVTAPFGGLLDFTTQRVLRHEIAAFRPTIALTYMSRASAAMPKGAFVHVARLGGYYDLKYYRHCDHLITITPDIKAHCERHGWPPERLHVIPNFIEDRRAPPLDRAALDTPENAPLVFALGRLHENKAFDILLEAMVSLPGVYLWLGGDGPLRGALEEQAKRLGIAERVRFPGWLDDPAPYFAATDVYVVPSRHEPLGSVVLEGWMSQVPMVAAASQGPRWLIREEENGLLVPIDDAPALAASIQRLIDEPQTAERLVQAGRATFEAEFTEDVAAARYLALFGSLLRNSASASTLPGKP